MDVMPPWNSINIGARVDRQNLILGVGEDLCAFAWNKQSSNARCCLGLQCMLETLAPFLSTCGSLCPC